MFYSRTRNNIYNYLCSLILSAISAQQFYGIGRVNQCPWHYLAFCRLYGHEPDDCVGHWPNRVAGIAGRASFFVESAQLATSDLGSSLCCDDSAYFCKGKLARELLEGLSFWFTGYGDYNGNYCSIKGLEMITDNELLGRIKTSPKIMVGKPVIQKTRLTVEYMMNLLAHGAARSELLEEYEG